MVSPHNGLEALCTTESRTKGCGSASTLRLECSHSVTLNPEKCFVKKEMIKFYGVIFGQVCIQLDTRKLSALQQMCAPYKSPETVELSWASRLHGFIYSKPKRTDSPAS